LRLPGLGANPVKRAVATLFAIGIILGMTGRGPIRGSLAAETNPQQPPAQASATASNAPRDGESETASLRAETLERLKAMGAVATPEQAAVASAAAATKADAPVPSAAHPSISADHIAQKPQQKLLEDRLHWLDEHAKLSLALKKAASPESSPEHQTDQFKAELKQLQAMLAQAAKNPDALLSPSFLKNSGTVPAVLATEMKDAIDATTHELGEWKNKAEALKSNKSEREAAKKKNAAERDKVFQLVTSLKARDLEFEKAVIDAQNPEQAQLARERQINDQWQVKVESLRLQVLEAGIALETKLTDVHELEARVCFAHIDLAEKELKEMRARFSAESKKQEGDLAKAAAAENSKAQSSGTPPLERFRARRTAELFELEAQVLKFEQALATSPSPSFEEQQSLADRADKDFVRVKQLLEDGRVSRLDAIILNNEFRLIGPERDKLVKNDMATVEARLQFFEDALTNVEIELLQNSLHDRYEQDLLRERASTEPGALVEELLNELEQQHRRILFRRRDALEKLSQRSSRTLQEIARRLSILDQEYGFIRTQIFWVRDQEPIAFGTFWQGAREVNVLLKAALRLARESATASLWGRPSAECMAMSLAVLLLPVPVMKLRRALGGMIES
jgi:potassium efflux system protein